MVLHLTRIKAFKQNVSLDAASDVAEALMASRLNLRRLGQLPAQKIQPSHCSKGLIVNLKGGHGSGSH